MSIIRLMRNPTIRSCMNYNPKVMRNPTIRSCRMNYSTVNNPKDSIFKKTMRFLDGTTKEMERAASKDDWKTHRRLQSKTYFHNPQIWDYRMFKLMVIARNENIFFQMLCGYPLFGLFCMRTYAGMARCAVVMSPFALVGYGGYKLTNRDDETLKE